MKFNKDISPATTFEFKVKLVAPTVEMAIPSKPAEKIKMESDIESIYCYSKPSVLLGDYNTPDKINHSFYFLNSIKSEPIWKLTNNIFCM